MRIFIGMPIYHYAEPETNQCVLNLLRDNSFEWRYNYVEDTVVHQARNRLAVDFMRSDCDALLFVDSDMVFDPDYINKLHDRLVGNNLGFISALAFAKNPPHPPVMGRGAGYSSFPAGNGPTGSGKFEALTFWDDGELLCSSAGAIDVMGMGLTLIDRAVFKKLEYPWFENITLNGHANGEDYSFCIKAKEAGIPFACDTSVIAGHIGKKVYGYDDWKRCNEKT